MNDDMTGAVGAAGRITPGDWRIGHCASVVTGQPRDDSERYYGGQVVCESISNRADALLIVAAKQMLAACEAVQAVLVEPAATGPVGMREMREWFARLIEARTAVRAAISRATGGDPP